MATSQKRQWNDIFLNFSAGSAALTPLSMNANTSSVANTIAVPGALVGDIVFVSTLVAQTAAIQQAGQVYAPGVVSIVFSNTTGGALIPVSTVYTVVACTLDPKMGL